MLRHVFITVQQRLRAIVLEHEGMYEFTKFMFNNKERWSEEHTNIYVHHPILQAL